MTTYRLPAWLGGHEVGEILRETDAGVLVAVNTGAEQTRIAVPRSVLVEVLPPIPDEPEPQRHYWVGPGKCACGFDTYELDIFFPDHHALIMDHLARNRDKDAAS